MTTLLANENIPRAMVLALRAAGHVVHWVAEEKPGIRDDEVLAWAHQLSAILLTYDRDYGELVYRRRLPAPVAVVFFRHLPQQPELAAPVLLPWLAEERIALLTGNFVVLSPEDARMRALPR